MWRAALLLLAAPAVAQDETVLVALRAPAARVAAALPADEVVIEQTFRSVPGFVARVTPAGLARLRAHPDVLAVGPDGLGDAALLRSLPQVRAERVRARGVGGRGVTIAVIDTGVDATHPDIADALVHEECFCKGGTVGGVTRRPCCPNGEARASGPGSAASHDAHGPHVAGIALSRGRVAASGVAPEAALVAVKVLDERNRGFLSDWIAALDWIASERGAVRVVNMSLVSRALYAGACEETCRGQSACAVPLLFAEVIDRLWSRGTLVVAASGNGNRINAMHAPACVGRALAVGAVDGADRLADFTNRSDGIDLLAPGVGIISDGLAGGLTELSGTSMAAPHVAGAAALLLAARPGLTAEAAAALLTGSGVAVDDARGGRVIPRLDAFAAFVAAQRAPELIRGGGGRGADCLLELSVVPADAVRSGARAIAACVDDDPRCDGDRIPGQCTFTVSMCSNVRDPLLRACRTDEPLTGFAIFAPDIDAPAGSLDRANADALAFALPDFPFGGENVCSIAVPFVVARPRSDRPGAAEIRMRVSTATRGDYDRVRLRCDPPR